MIIITKKVNKFSGHVELVTSNGDILKIIQNHKDDSFELVVKPNGKQEGEWYRVNFGFKTINERLY